jgi:hypothetical protein
MTKKFLISEIIYVGNSLESNIASGIIQYWEPSNSHITIINVTGDRGFVDGDLVFGAESGESGTFNGVSANGTNGSFEVIEAEPWDDWTYLFDRAIVCDGGWIALDSHFTGNVSSDYSREFIITVD